MEFTCTFVYVSLNARNVISKSFLAIIGTYHYVLVTILTQTAHQSTFLIYEIAKRPEVQEKLYEEIKNVLGDRQPTAEDLAAMPYTKGCVMESFRYSVTLVLLSSNVLALYSPPPPEI